MAVFNFSPAHNVPETLPRDGWVTSMSLNGWQFSARPTTPYQRRFKVRLNSMQWYENEDGTFDKVTNYDNNARALEAFYEEHEMWKPFTFVHQHYGNLTCRFAAPVVVPAGEQNGGGFIKAVEVMLIQHNPGYGAL